MALALNDIVTKARQVDELAAEVANASREQTQGITQINVAVGQMDKVTQSNAASAEESAAAAQELSSQAETMKQAVAELMRLVGGEQMTSPTAQPGRPVVSSKPSVVTNVSHRSNGHAPKSPSQFNATAKSPRSAIPLDDDFKNF